MVQLAVHGSVHADLDRTRLPAGPFLRSGGGLGLGLVVWDVEVSKKGGAVKAFVIVLLLGIACGQNVQSHEPLPRDPNAVQSKEPLPMQVLRTRKHICRAVGTAANPSIADCGSAIRGSVACSVAASGGRCSILTTAITLKTGWIHLFPITNGAALRVTCNASEEMLAGSTISEETNYHGFTFSLPKFTTNPACFGFDIAPNKVVRGHGYTITFPEAKP